MKKIVLTCVLVFSACCVTLFAQKDKKEKETVKIECCCEDCTCRECKMRYKLLGMQKLPQK